MATDFELLDAWGDGDQRAARELFDRYYRPVFRFFRNKVDRSIEDLVQETFLGCVQGRERIGRDASFRAYLFGTARNVLSQHFRRRRVREDRIDFGTDSVHDLGAGPMTILARRGEHRLLLEALRRIPIDAQIVIELYHWEQLTGPELAAVLGLTEPAVRSRLHRARARMREEVERIGAEPALLQSTLSDLDGWASGVRGLVEEALP